MMRAWWKHWGSLLGVWLVTSGCVVRQGPAPRPGPPPMVAPIGASAPPVAGAGGSAHGFQGGTPGTIPAGAARGRPVGMHPGAPAAMWIWLNHNGVWRVRTTTAGQAREFRGEVQGVSAPLQQLGFSRNELRDGVRLEGGRVTFAYTTVGHVDGFDFAVTDRGCVRFVLDRSQPFAVFVGVQRVSPGGGEFVLCP